jgi:hypothetical protein
MSQLELQIEVFETVAHSAISITYLYHVRSSALGYSLMGASETLS